MSHSFFFTMKLERILINSSTKVNTILEKWSDFFDAKVFCRIHSFYLLIALKWKSWFFFSCWMHYYIILKQLIMWEETRKGSPFIGASWVWSIVHNIDIPPNRMLLHQIRLKIISIAKSNSAGIWTALSENIILPLWGVLILRNFVDIW